MSRPERPVRVVAIADSDSYLKWAAALLDQLVNAAPSGWTGTTVLLNAPTAPDRIQVRAALSPGRRVLTLGAPALLRELTRDPPDVVLLACTGPVVAWLLRRRAFRGPDRPLILSGLPGMALPATARGWEMRRGIDLFVTHSRVEQAAYEVLRRPGHEPVVALTRLPFVPVERTSAGAAIPATVRPLRPRVVFAAQPSVPAAPVQRCAILRALADLAASRPDLDVVVKLRARRGQAQTHREDHPYPDLWRDLVAAGAVEPGSVRFADGAMREQLIGASGLVTVSSTAVLEAMAAGLAVRVLGDFGVDDVMLTRVFIGSGVIGDLDDLRAGSFRRPDPSWCAANYFHPVREDTFGPTLVEMVGQRRVRPPAPRLDLPPVPRPSAVAELRAAVRLALPPPWSRALSNARRRGRSPAHDGADQPA